MSDMRRSCNLTGIRSPSYCWIAVGCWPSPNVGRSLPLDDLAVGCGKVDRRADVTWTQIELVGQGGHRMLGVPVVWRRRHCNCRDNRERGVPSGHSATRHWGARRCPEPSVGVESVRRLSAVSRRTSGSTTACWSTWSSLTSANSIVPQSVRQNPRRRPRLLARQQLGDCDVLKLWERLTIDTPGACKSRRDPIASRTPFQKRTGESRRRASYSTTMSLPDTDTVPRPRGQTFVSLLNVVPSPGIFAKICWGPRTICPFSTS